MSSSIRTATPGGRRRHRLAIASVALLAAWLAACAWQLVAASAPAGAQSGPTWPVLVADYYAGNVMDIGPTWTSTISVGAGPTDIAITPDGLYAYVAVPSSNIVSVIANPATPGAHVVRTLSISGEPFQIAITPDGKYAYVSDYTNGKVSVIDNADSASPSVSASALSVGSAPSEIAITPDGKYAYVANYNSRTVSVIDNADSASPSVSASTLSVGTDPAGVAITPDGKYAYVNNDGAASVSVIDNADSASPSVSATTLSVATDPEDIEVTPDGNTVYTVNFGSNDLSVITGADTSSPSVSGTIAAGSNPWVATVVPDQAPVAKLSVIPGQSGSATSFNASASTVAYGTISTYAWSFGDGTQATTSTPTTTHTYGALGTYAATVTETDSAGTSTSVVTIGKDVLDDGGAGATASASITIATLCSPSSGEAGCAVSTTLSVGSGTLSLTAPSELYWDDVLSGYDQWESASSSALSSCAGSGKATACSSGTSPGIEVIDATGSGDGWALSEYLSSSDLPAGSLVDFDGAGSTPGTSVAARLSSFPFSATTPATVCDYGSHCTPASTSSSCTHQSLGFTACASYPVSLAGGTAATAQVDLYSAAAGSGMGAVCLASGSASAIGCSGTTPDADLDLGLPANARTGAYGTTVINVTVSSGP